MHLRYVPFKITVLCNTFIANSTALEFDLTSWGTSLAPSASQTKHTAQQGKVCWHCVLDCGLGPRLVARSVKKIDSLDWRFWSTEQSGSSSNINKTVQFKQCTTAAMTQTFYTTFTQPLLAYTANLLYTWSDNIIQKPLTVYSVGIRTSQEASQIITKHQEGLGYTRPGRETSLGWEGRLFRESRPGRKTRLGRETSLGFEDRLFRKSRLDRDSKLNRDISFGCEGGPCRESRLGRESRLSRETSLW